MTTVYTRASHVLHRNVGPDVLAMIPGQDAIHLISGPAAVMWDLLDQHIALDEAIGEISELYVLPIQEIAPSLASCVRDLTRRGLVEEHRA